MLKTARSTRISTQACTPVADSGPRGSAGPSCQPHGTGEAADCRDLTDGEVSGPVKVTGVLPTPVRTQRCSCARKEGGRGSGAGLSSRSQAPVRRSSLRRGIIGR